MTDIAIAWSADAARGDLALASGDLASDPSGLRTAIVLSLFSDARHLEAAPGADPRGWWGDAAGDAGDATGSLLWLLDRETERDEVATRAEGYAREALAWCVADGVADRIEVSAEWTARGVLEIRPVLRIGDAIVFNEVFNAS